MVAALDDAALLWVETPTNPALEVADLPALAEAAHAAGASVVCDNTFATPLRQRPLDLGADIVVHSATKYLSGHADLVLGAVVTRDDQALAGAGRAAPHASVRSPVSWRPGWPLRGMRTLALRVDRAEANARRAGRRLGEHPAVSRVRYPGFGGIVAIELAGGALAADLLCHSDRGVGARHQPRRSRVDAGARRRWAGEPSPIPEDLVRLSVGVRGRRRPVARPRAGPGSRQLPRLTARPGFRRAGCEKRHLPRCHNAGEC